MFHFKIILYVIARVIIEQLVCIATTLIMWEMWILLEKKLFEERKTADKSTD